MSLQPDFDMNGVDLNEVEDIFNGVEVMNKITDITRTRQFERFSFMTYDKNGTTYEYECLGFVTLERYGVNRLYLGLHYANASEEDDMFLTYYMARRNKDLYVIVQELDEKMRETFHSAMFDKSEKSKGTNESNDEDIEAAPKKKKNGWLIALKIICFPFWLLWQFIKAILSLLGVAFGDNAFVKGFKSGLNGTSNEYKEYTFTNDMGCRQTVYSRDGKTFYSSDGSYVGTSNDGGKTIR